MTFSVRMLAVSLGRAGWTGEPSAILAWFIFVTPVDFAHFLDVVVEEVSAAGLVDGRTEKLAKVLVVT